MARKFDLISELYERTCFAVTDNPVNWQSFLKTAGRNFRLRFDEQLLIYAQRPDATAVLEIERWNGTFGRWVNRGAKGIAVFEDADRSRQRLIHYFDISDTHESRHSRPVPIWEMRPEYEAEVIETLENTFGAVNDTTSIENVVKESIANAVEDNIADYISDFMSLGAGSDIEYLSADEANALYLELVRNSVSYMVMARLGLDADKVYSPDDFVGISNFNSQEVLNAVGIATSDIAEMALLPVSRTISTLSKENRIIDEQGQSEYNKDIKDERSQSDERNHIHDGGRLQSSEPEIAGADGSDSRQMVADEENLSEGTSQNPVLQSSDERDYEQSLGGGSAESERTGGNSRKADGRESGTDRADESGRYDEMGSPDEQHQELGTGNREESGNIRYTEEQRTYVVSSNNKAFIEGMGGYSIYASSLDGSDKCVRLEAYMADEHGGKDGWKIEKCYVKDDSNREMLDIIAGKFFIAYAPIESEKFLSMPKELARKYEEKFKYPERFYKSLDGIEAKPYKPVSKDMER